MPARVQDAGDGRSFTIWDDNDKLAVTLTFDTTEAKDKSAEEAKAILARATRVNRLGCVGGFW
jgi:hypothetical protein